MIDMLLALIALVIVLGVIAYVFTVLFPLPHPFDKMLIALMVLVILVFVLIYMFPLVRMSLPR